MDFASTFKILARSTPMEKLQDSLKKLAQKYPTILLGTSVLDETTNKITVRVSVPVTAPSMFVDPTKRPVIGHEDRRILLCNTRGSVVTITDKVDDLAIEYGVEAKPAARWFSRFKPTLAVPTTH